MTPSRTRAPLTIHGRSTASVVVLLTLLVCPERAAPLPSPTSETHVGQSGLVGIQGPLADVAAAIRARLVGDLDSALGALSDRERTDLDRLYEMGGGTPYWVDATGRPSQHAHEALMLVESAAAEGLDPADYGAAWLRGLAVTVVSGEPPLVGDVARFDVGLSAAMLRYFRHAHMGRIDPRAVGFRLRVPEEHHNFAMLLHAALVDHRITETAAELAPPLVQYRALRAMLARYRALVASTAFDAWPPGPLRPGEASSRLPGLHRRLVAFGDLPSETSAPAEGAVYDGALVDAVKQYQMRHGLEADGIIGTATGAALRVPLAWRVRQIELSLERLRWLPDLGDERFLALNIPMYHLWAWDAMRPTGAPSFGMRAIVGRALRTPTPVFVEEMRYVIFRPYWNIPRSILRKEILPILERDLDYLRGQQMEIVRGFGDDAPAVAATPEHLALLKQGMLRLRQRPGPRNALGLVTFVFPNDEHVYLHGTPAQELFGRTRRDFSHGCVRVEDPVTLAAWVLNDQPAWTRDRIVAAMSGMRPRRVNLTRPIPVILFYLTAVVMPEDGTIHFAEDIYRQDPTLDHALTRQPSTR